MEVLYKNIMCEVAMLGNCNTTNQNIIPIIVNIAVSTLSVCLPHYWDFFFLNHAMDIPQNKQYSTQWFATDTVNNPEYSFKLLLHWAITAK